jgi:hypothetical protein
VRVALACLLVALAAVPSAAAQTVGVDWRESFYPDYPREHRITFRVSRVVVKSGSWTVRAAFTNRTPWRLRIAPADPTGWRVGMGLVSPRPRSGTWYPWNPSSPEVDTFRANRFLPRMPRSLAPGESWSGQFGGAGTLPRGRSIYVKFGQFVPPRRVAVRVRAEALSWTTNHAFRL